MEFQPTAIVKMVVYIYGTYVYIPHISHGSKRSAITNYVALLVDKALKEMEMTRVKLEAAPTKENPSFEGGKVGANTTYIIYLNVNKNEFRGIMYTYVTYTFRYIYQPSLNDVEDFFSGSVCSVKGVFHLLFYWGHRPANEPQEVCFKR